MVEVPIAAMAEAIKGKRIDTAFLPDPFMTIALGDPALTLLDWPMSKVYAQGPGALYVVTPQLAAERTRDVRAFVRAYTRGAAWINANTGKDALYGLIANYSQMNVDVVRRMRMPAANAPVIPSSLARVTALMTYTGIATGGVDLRTKIFS